MYFITPVRRHGSKATWCSSDSHTGHFVSPEPGAAAALPETEVDIFVPELKELTLCKYTQIKAAGDTYLPAAAANGKYSKSSFWPST